MPYQVIEYLAALVAARLWHGWRPVSPTEGGRSRRWGRTDLGQATPEYALVILAAVALAATLIVWAKKSGAIAELFEFVIGKVKEAADR